MGASHVSYSRLSSYQGPTRTVVGGFTAPITAPDEESPVHDSVQKGSASHASYPRLSSYQGPTRTVVGGFTAPITAPDEESPVHDDAQTRSMAQAPPLQQSSRTSSESAAHAPTATLAREPARISGNARQNIGRVGEAPKNSSRCCYACRSAH